MPGDLLWWKNTQRYLYYLSRSSFTMNDFWKFILLERLHNLKTVSQISELHNYSWYVLILSYNNNYKSYCSCLIIMKHHIYIRNQKCFLKGPENKNYRLYNIWRDLHNIWRCKNLSQRAGCGLPSLVFMITWQVLSNSSPLTHSSAIINPLLFARHQECKKM